jgi:hypothetical protein
MLFNRDILFLHVPKTGGMAVTKYLLDVLERPVYYTQPDHDPELEASGVIQIPGIRHENLVDAQALVKDHGFELDQFAAILAVMRNPYDLEVSRFAYLQNNHAWDRGHNQDLAMAGDFEAFAKDSSDHGGSVRSIQTYFQFDGVTPKNLRILRTERLEKDLKSALLQVGIASDEPLLLDNQSQHEAPEKYYSLHSEEAVYQRYKWLFEQGYYPRMAREHLPPTIPCPISGPVIPIAGPVLQIGFSSGLWQDAWVDKKLIFHVRAKEDVRQVVIKGTFPKNYAERIAMDLVVNQSVKTTVIELPREHTPFELGLDCFLPSGTNAKLEIAPSSHWCPRNVSDSLDTRDLTFHLHSVLFAGNCLASL